MAGNQRTEENSEGDESAPILSTSTRQHLDDRPKYVGRYISNFIKSKNIFQNKKFKKVQVPIYTIFVT